MTRTLSLAAALFASVAFADDAEFYIITIPKPCPTCPGCASPEPTPIPRDCTDRETVTLNAVVNAPTQLVFSARSSFGGDFQKFFGGNECALLAHNARYSCTYTWDVPVGSVPYEVSMEYFGTPTDDPVCVYNSTPAG